MAQFHAQKDPAVSRREREHMALARKAAAECIVLLENNGMLPLGAGARLALYGAGARQTVRGGTGSGDVNSRSSLSVEEGLTGAGFVVTTGAWLDRQSARRAGALQAHMEKLARQSAASGVPAFLLGFSDPFREVAPEAITEGDILASATDTAIYVISRNSGEGADRRDEAGDYKPFEEELQQLRLLGQRYAKVAVVLNIGGVMELEALRAIPGVGALVLMGQLGNIGGAALADVLGGRVCPSGRLSDTWAVRYEDYPSSATFSHNDGNVDDEYYTEGIYVGYRYFDTFGVQPLYPFGYGLSYTTFLMTPHAAQVQKAHITLPVTVTNTGAHAGKEVVQVYCRPPQGKLAKPLQSLVGFAKSALLAPGASETVQVTFTADQLASYCPECSAWVLEAGEYVLCVGADSRRAAPAAVLTLDETVRLHQLKNLFADTDPVQELTPPPRPAAPVDATLPRTALSADGLSTQTAHYTQQRQPFAPPADSTALTLEDVRSGRADIEQLTAQLSVEQLAALCVGALRSAEGASIVGNASAAVPGAAGETWGGLYQARGIKNVIMADGPAGLRLQPVFKTDKAGGLLPGGEMMGDICEPFDPSLTPQNSDTWYQYCTAIPIGWALAQSWDMPLLEKVGAMVGAEMELFGVDLWLAPALNIHRNPLCGRNFEYYSEDPLISGRAAAAITNGVQSCRGKGATIKHFAANNQEDNRYFTNSHVSERALREIYLRGFEIAIKESHPLSVMTSYNLINGHHAANHRDLLQAVLRDEWGYQGLVMTDWYTSQAQPAFTGNSARYPISASSGCVWAGNDLQMPGCEKNAQDLVHAVTTGEAVDGYAPTLADLQHCAARVLRTAVITSV